MGRTWARQAARTGLRRGAWVGGAILGAVLLGTSWHGAELGAREQPKAATKGALPADLDRIPRDSILAVSIRVADVWNSDLGKDLRKRLAKDLPKILDQYQQVVGVAPAVTERVTVVQVEVRQNEPLIFVATTEAYDKVKVLQTLAPGAKEEKRKEHTFYASDKKKAVYFIDPRAYVFSSPDAIAGLLERDPKKAGALTAGLQLAAGKHLATAAVNAGPIAEAVPADLPPDAEPFKPFLKMRLGTATFDLGEAATTVLRATFGKEGDAKEAAKGAEALLELIRGQLPQAIEAASKDPEGMKVVGMMKEFEAALKAVKVEQKGTTLHLAIAVKLDADAAATLVEAVTKVRSAAGRVRSANNLKQIALAMHNYHDVNGQLPPRAVFNKDGKALLSWRVLILPYIEQDALYKQFHLDEAWDSPHNKKLLDQMPRTYALAEEQPKSETFYQGFVGKGAFFEGTKGLKLPADFPDGTSNTIMIVEAARSVPWSKPDDVPFDPAKPLPKLGGHFPNGFNASMCDGSVRFISQSISETTLKAAITRNGGEVLGDDF